MEVINPIYDTSFKYLMEDDKSAKILLSALLRKKVVTLTPQKIEKRRAEPGDCWLLIYSLCYSVGIVTDDGCVETICVEIRKVWLQTELADFHFYLANKFDPDENVQSDVVEELRSVVIYIMAHEIFETDEPVVYCHGGELTNYYGAPLRPATGGRLVSGLRGDIIVVQTPRLPQYPRNAAERILYFFDQRLALSSDSRFIVVPNSDDDDSEPAVLLRRLCSAACTDDIRRQMLLEREYLVEIQSRDEEILLQKALIGMRSKKLKEQKQQAVADRQKAEAEKQRAEAEKQKAEADRQKAEAEKQKAEADRQKAEMLSMRRAAVMSLAKTGMPAVAIAEVLGLDSALVKGILEGK